MICSAFCSRSRAARVLITPKQTYRGRTDRLINATGLRWMAHLFVHHRLPILLSVLLTGLFFNLYLFCSTVYIRSTCGIQAVGTTVIFHIHINEDLAILIDQTFQLPRNRQKMSHGLRTKAVAKYKKQCCELIQEVLRHNIFYSVCASCLNS